MIKLPTIEMEEKSLKGERNQVLQDHYYIFADSETTTEKNLEVEGKVRTVIVGGITWGVNEQRYLESTTMFGFLQQCLAAFNKWKFATRKAYHPKNWKPSCLIYFHNLKFDNSFILNELYHVSGTILSMNDMRKQQWMLDKLSALKISKYDTVETITKKLKKCKRHEKIDLEGVTYTTEDAESVKAYVEKMTWAQAVLTTEMGTWYFSQIVTPSMDIIEIRDSAKLYALPIAKLGESVGIKKLNDEQEKDWDYEKYRPLGYQINERERMYFLHDIEILAKLLSGFLMNQNELYLTRSRYAFEALKNDVNSRVIELSTGKQLDPKKGSIFERLFPPTKAKERNLIQRAYKGGVVWVYDEACQKGLVYDVNSEYPANMSAHDYPVGEGIPGKGQYQRDPEHPWYIQFFTAKFSLKKNKWATPFLNGKFSKNGKVVRSSDDLLDCYKVLALSCTDLAQFFKHYDVQSINYVGYLKYTTARLPFKHFIEKHYGAKQEATDKMAEAKAKGEEWHQYEAPRQEAKLTMNGCYGYFAKRTINASILTTVGADGKIKNETEAYELGDGNNLAVAIAITSYARDQLLNAVISASDRIMYVDTDSIHVKGWAPIEAKGFRVHRSEIGAWKIESKFIRARYLRKKTYAEETLKDSNDPNGETYLLVKFAGLDSDAKKANLKKVEDLTFRTYTGVKVARRVNGGVLIDSHAAKTIVRDELGQGAKYSDLKPAVRAQINEYATNLNKINKAVFAKEGAPTVEEYKELTRNMETAPEDILKYARGVLEQYNNAVTMGQAWNDDDKNNGEFAQILERQTVIANHVMGQFMRGNLEKVIDFASIEPALQAKFNDYATNVVQLLDMVCVKNEVQTVEEYNVLTHDMETAPEGVLKYARNVLEQYNYVITMGLTWDQHKKSDDEFMQQLNRQLPITEILFTDYMQESHDEALTIFKNMIEYS